MTQPPASPMGPNGPTGPGVPNGGGPAGPAGPGGPGVPGGPGGGSPSYYGQLPAGFPPARTPAPTLFNGATIGGITGPKMQGPERQKGIRHPWEIPLLIVGIVITAVAYLLWFGLIVLTIVNLIRGSGPTLFSLDQSVFGSLFFQLYFFVLILPIVLWIARALMYAQMRADGVRMSPTQFPEGYRIVAEAARQYGMRRVPDAYVLLGNGQINAFAAGHGLRRFVCVYSDMFEVGGAVRDPEALRFVIGHEVGHLAAGHVSYFRLLFSNLLQQIPILGTAYSRAQEYTADNFGYTFCPEGSVGVMAVLGAGKYLNAEVNVHELADRAATEKGLWLHIANWQSTHPILTWRAHALRDRSRPGHLWLRPGILDTPGAAFPSAMPAGSIGSDSYLTPDEAIGLLDRADQMRPAGDVNHFGRFPGAEYPDRPPMRTVQISRPLV